MWEGWGKERKAERWGEGERGREEEEEKEEEEEEEEGKKTERRGGVK